MLNWKNSERNLGYIITDMLNEKDPSGSMEFTASDIYEYCRSLNLIGDEHIGANITSILRSLKIDRQELIQPRGDYHPYKISNKGFLSVLLNLKHRYYRLKK